MNLAISTYSLLRWRRESGKTLDQSVDWIADTGVKGIEFAGLDDGGSGNPIQRARALRRRCERRGLMPISYCVAADLLQARNAQRQQIEQLKTHVDVAAELGVPSMRHDVAWGFGPKNATLRVPHTFAAALKIVVPAIRAVADYGAERGIKTSLENHGFFMQASKRVEQLIKAVDHPNFGLTIDMGNFLCVNEDPIEAVERLAKYAVMAHVKDFHVRRKRAMPPDGWFKTPTPIALRGAIAGHGVIDIPRQIKLLKRAGYDGWLSLEFEGLEEPTKAVEMGLNYLRTLGLS